MTWYALNRVPFTGLEEERTQPLAHLRITHHRAAVIARKQRAEERRDIEAVRALPRAAFPALSPASPESLSTHGKPLCTMQLG